MSVHLVTLAKGHSSVICQYFHRISTIKGLLHCFSSCIEITGDNCYCFIFRNIENCKEKFERVKKL